VLVADGPVGSRRDSIKRTIAGIHEGGGTNIGAGLAAGYQQAHAETIPIGAVKVVMLLSDGRANAGITKQGALSGLALRAFQDGIQTSSFGLGSDFDGPLMSSIAGDGAGGYYYLKDADQIRPALETELERRADPVASGVEVRVRLAAGVELLKVYGSRKLGEDEASRVRAQEIAVDAHAAQKDDIRKDRQEDAEGGMRFFIPAFARDDSHAILMELRVPAGTDARRLASLEVKYKDHVTKQNGALEKAIQIEYAKSEAESAGSKSLAMVKAVQAFGAGEALAEASRRVARGDRAGAAQVLGDRESTLRGAAKLLDEPALAQDANRFARFKGFVAGPGKGTGEPLLLAMMLETASGSHLH